MLLCFFFPFTVEDIRKGSPVDRNSFLNNMIGAAGNSFLFTKHKKIYIGLWLRLPFLVAVLEVGLEVFLKE